MLYLVIVPNELVESLRTESKRLVKLVYEKDVQNIYYRVKTRQTPGDPRRLFIKGDGRLLETEVKPHLSLVHNIELKNPKHFIEQAKLICRKYRPFRLEYAGVGNYGKNFTIFVRFKADPELAKLRSELLALSRPHMGKEEFDQQKAAFIPHATLLYDDLAPAKVKKAYKLAKNDTVRKAYQVSEVFLWGVTPFAQKIVSTFPLQATFQ